MARPQKCRNVCREPEHSYFIPDGIACSGNVILSVDEYETIRLMDREQKTHEEAARQMGISRTTVTEIYENARRKIAESIVDGKVLVISGGNYRICGGRSKDRCDKSCRHQLCVENKIINTKLNEKGSDIMRIAVTYEKGNIFQHFGHTEQFKIYDTENGEITSSKVVSTMGSGHGALAGFLTENGVDILICGGIGGGAQIALKEAGIKLFGGVSGEADKAVEDLLKNNLQFNPDVKCNHHEHSSGHNCGEHEHGHSCGSHECHE